MKKLWIGYRDKLFQHSTYNMEIYTWLEDQDTKTNIEDPEEVISDNDTGTVEDICRRMIRI